MPIWLLPLLLKYVLPLIIQWLEKEGFMGAAESLAAKGVANLYVDLKNIKTEGSYPIDKDTPIGSINDLVNGK